MAPFAHGESSLSFPWFFPSIASELIRDFLHVDPAARPSMDAAMSYRFFSGLNFMDLEKRRLQPPHVPKIEDAHDTSNFAELSDSDDSDEEEEEVGEDGAKKEKPPPKPYSERFPAFTVLQPEA